LRKLKAGYEDPSNFNFLIGGWKDTPSSFGGDADPLWWPFVIPPFRE